VLNRQGPLSTEENQGIIWTCFDGAERQPGGRAGFEPVVSLGWMRLPGFS